jgi:hypothetical protein
VRMSPEPREASTSTVGQAANACTAPDANAATKQVVVKTAAISKRRIATDGMS